MRGEHGGCTYLYDVLSYLKGRGWEIECIYLNEAPAGAGYVFEIPRAVRDIVKLRCPGNLNIAGRLIRFRGIRNAFRKKGAAPAAPVAAIATGSDRIASERETACAAALARRFKPDVILADFTFLAGALPPRKGRAVRAILTHDVLHERVGSLRQFGAGGTWGEWTEEREGALLARADMVIAISEEEAESLRRMNPAAKVVVAPMSCSGVSPLPAEVQVPGRCLFVGGGDAHNVHGLKWFLAEVWPLVLARLPAASLHVCGGVGAALERGFPNVSLLGHVPDLALEYAGAEACVAPILAGSGIKIKVVEALSYGRACVTTPEGLRGLSFLRDGVCLADGAEAFGRAVGDVLTSPEVRRKLERDGRRAVSEFLSPDACHSPFARAVEAALPDAQPSCSRHGP